jgi:hypothetical protein
VGSLARGLAVLLVVLAGCGSEGGASSAPRYDLTITFWPQGSDSDARTATLTCDPDGGSHPDPATACNALLAHEDALAPVAGDVACTEIYGGAQIATISGAAFRARFDRTNGCEIARWDALKAVLELPG